MQVLLQLNESEEGHTAAQLQIITEGGSSGLQYYSSSRAETVTSNCFDKA